MEQNSPKNPFQESLNLPKTEFSIRANAAQKEPELLQRWEAEKLAQQVTIKNKGSKKYILHDGPPYANGNLHIGHALTYILKDFVCKAKRMAGFHAPLVPGWDCHGLPIELKVTTERGLEKDRSKVDRIEFKKYCREFAQHWIEVQKQELKELGKLADYEHAYKTMDPHYEADILRAFAIFVEKGHIERKLKTVPWCGSCQTVLATAEIEYKDRKDPSIYVLFPLLDRFAHVIFPFVFEKNPDLKISLAVWTTTPWTLPLNRAVVLNPSAVYVVLQSKEPNQAFIVAKDLADKVCKELGIERVELAECDAIVFQGKKVAHPFIDGQETPIFLDEMVQIGEGTACLHSAPGCGPEDYLFGVKNNLEIYSPLSSDGRYTKGIKPTSFEGVAITEALKPVFDLLNEKKTLLHKTSITHSYPHCWRCRNGLMFRATNQWFCDLSKNNLVPNTLAAIEKMTFVPDRGQARLHSFIASRTEWCVSRQRQWGTPITALMCQSCNRAFLSAQFIRAVADHVAKEGIEFWDRMSVPQLIKENILSSHFACDRCGNKDHEKFELERDILDVWFDSGASSFAVLERDKANLGVPADLYFEGSDQHRGWFQSSVLCGMVLHGHPPMKAIATHGFVVDENKRKMSKSVGNVVAPQDIIKKYSRDILRLWVASADFQDDLVISEKLLQNVTEMYRKIRNTCRFLIANLYDFDITKDAVEVDEMWALDQYALARLYELDVKVRASYDQFSFSGVINAINTYCTNDLSAVYLDILKDRLYVEKPDGLARRSAQTAMYHTLDVITRLMAPVLSFLAEETSDFYQMGKQESIHLQDFSAVLNVWDHLAHRLDADRVHLYSAMHDTFAVSFAVHKQGEWNVLEMVRAAVLKAIETKREQNVVKHSYEAAVTIFIDPARKEAETLKLFIDELQHKGEDVTRFFKDWFVVSGVVFAQQAEGIEASVLPWLHVAVEHAQGVKCPRCWRWDTSGHPQHLCTRCKNVVE